MLLAYSPVICHDHVTPSSGTASPSVPPFSLKVLGEITPGAAGLRACRPQPGDESLTTPARDWGAVMIRRVVVTMAALDPFPSDCLSGGVASP